MFERTIPGLFRPHVARVLHFGLGLGDLADVCAEAETWQEWSRALERKGDQYADTARRALAEQRAATAAECGLRAAAYFHYAQFKLSGDEPATSALRNKSRLMYRESACQFSPPATRLDIPCGDFNLVAYYRQAHSYAPCVVLINGLDSAKEVELHHFGDVFLRRGLSVLALDGPGQGECLTQAPLLPGFEWAVSRVIDFLQREGVATFGLFGVSFGGHLAARVAAHDHRIAATVCLGGFFDSTIFSALPSPAAAALRSAFHWPSDQELSSLHHMVTLEPFRNLLDRPLLVIHGQHDHLVSEQQADAIIGWASGPAQCWKVENAEHVCADRFAEVLPAMGDWMCETLTASTRVTYSVGTDDENRSLTFVDLSVSLEPSPSERLPAEIERVDHEVGAAQMSEVFGIPPELLPQHQGWAGERLTLTTHTGTHMDAPWHYGPVCHDRPARTIDEVPLSWCYGPGVILDVSAKPDGSEITPLDVSEALSHIPHRLSPGDIVLAYTGASRDWGSPEYPNKGAGFGRDAILWLVHRGIRVIGTDAWGLDRPFDVMAEEYRRTGDPRTIWPAHFAGRDVEYCQLEKLRNLERLPRVGFTVACFPVAITQGSAGWVRAVAIVHAGQNGKG